MMKKLNLVLILLAITGAIICGIGKNWAGMCWALVAGISQLNMFQQDKYIKELESKLFKDSN